MANLNKVYKSINYATNAARNATEASKDGKQYEAYESQSGFRIRVVRTDAPGSNGVKYTRTWGKRDKLFIPPAFKKAGCGYRFVDKTDPVRMSGFLQEGWMVDTEIGPQMREAGFAPHISLKDGTDYVVGNMVLMVLPEHLKDERDEFFYEENLRTQRDVAMQFGKAVSDSGGIAKFSS